MVIQRPGYRRMRDACPNSQFFNRDTSKVFQLIWIL
jgi:hypothetical protein